ncbi:MAG TPA: DNA polymerase Y family protein [Terriglobales bacterium]|nr:DNA polymerase Y family protein [Terriglobales bacterium]
MPFACIYVPDFPAEAILRSEPGLRANALAVLEGKPPLERIFALNEKARLADIDLGMTKNQVEACTGLVLRSRSLVQETSAHAALLDCAQSFSPVVENTACDTVLLDLAGLESLFGQPAKIARDLARRASDLGMEANVAVASNPDAALIAARGFPGVTVIAPGKEAERLGQLSLEVLFGGFPGSEEEKQGQELLDTLERWGVRNLRALAALPEIPLAERLGQRGLHLQKLARGNLKRTLVVVDPVLSFEEAAELEYPLLLLEPLALLLQHMLEQLCARLGSRALATQKLQLKLDLENGCIADEATEPANANSQKQEAGHPRTSSFTRTLQLPVPMLDAKVFLKLLQLDLSAHPPGAPIVKVHLSAEPACARHTQSGLFQPVAPEPEKLELTLARISGLVGEGRAGSIELLDTHRPEAFRMQHFSPGARQNQKASKEQCEDQAGNGAPLTALRIFRPPLGAMVKLRDGKPAHVVCERRQEVQGEIVWLAGPWRSSGDWWQQDGWAREEWDIALPAETGMALYRLTRDLFRGRWFVEGTYD